MAPVTVLVKHSWLLAASGVAQKAREENARRKELGKKEDVKRTGNGVHGRRTRTADVDVDGREEWGAGCLSDCLRVTRFVRSFNAATNANANANAKANANAEAEAACACACACACQRQSRGRASPSPNQEAATPHRPSTLPLHTAALSLLSSFHHILLHSPSSATPPIPHSSPHSLLSSRRTLYQARTNLARLAQLDDKRFRKAALGILARALDGNGLEAGHGGAGTSGNGSVGGKEPVPPGQGEIEPLFELLELLVELVGDRIGQPGGTGDMDPLGKPATTSHEGEFKAVVRCLHLTLLRISFYTSLTTTPPTSYGARSSSARSSPSWRRVDVFEVNQERFTVALERAEDVLAKVEREAVGREGDPYVEYLVWDATQKVHHVLSHTTFISTGRRASTSMITSRTHTRTHTRTTSATSSHPSDPFPSSPSTPPSPSSHPDLTHPSVSLTTLSLLSTVLHSTRTANHHLAEESIKRALERRYLNQGSLWYVLEECTERRAWEDGTQLVSHLVSCAAVSEKCLEVYLGLVLPPVPTTSTSTSASSSISTSTQPPTPAPGPDFDFSQTLPNLSRHWTFSAILGLGYIAAHGATRDIRHRAMWDGLVRALKVFSQSQTASTPPTLPESTTGSSISDLTSEDMTYLRSATLLALMDLHNHHVVTDRSDKVTARLLAQGHHHLPGISIADEPRTHLPQRSRPEEPTTSVMATLADPPITVRETLTGTTAGLAAQIVSFLIGERKKERSGGRIMVHVLDNLAWKLVPAGGGVLNALGPDEHIGQFKHKTTSGTVVTATSRKPPRNPVPTPHFPRVVHAVNVAKAATFRLDQSLRKVLEQYVRIRTATAGNGTRVQRRLSAFRVEAAGGIDSAPLDQGADVVELDYRLKGPQWNSHTDLLAQMPTEVKISGRRVSKGGKVVAVNLKVRRSGLRTVEAAAGNTSSGKSKTPLEHKDTDTKPMPKLPSKPSTLHGVSPSRLDKFTLPRLAFPLEGREQLGSAGFLGMAQSRTAWQG